MMTLSELIISSHLHVSDFFHNLRSDVNLPTPLQTRILSNEILINKISHFDLGARKIQWNCFETFGGKKGDFENYD